MKSSNNSLLRKEISPRQLVTSLSIVYSVAIIATITPPVGRVVPTIFFLVYYLLVPGYCVSLLLGESYDFLQRTLMSIFISMSLSLALLATNHISRSFDIPLAVSLPVISIAIIIYGYYSHRW